MIDLTQFCSPLDIREELHQPTSDSKHTYATDGKILIRVARRDDVAKTAFVVKCTDLMTKNTIEGREFVSIPKLPKPQMVECDNCDGTGIVCDGCGRPNVDMEIKAGHEENCDECDGTGKVTERMRVVIDGVGFDRKYLALLKTLPNCTISIGRETEPAWFKFDGGNGLLMPLRA